MNKLITELVLYGMKEELICEDDRIYTVNRLLELFGLSSYEEVPVETVRPLPEILEDMTVYAGEHGIAETDSVTERDLFDTKIMGILTPPPSVVRERFHSLCAESTKKATDWYYHFSRATHYIRTERIARNESWIAETKYGPMDITINLSKPEKDPRDIAKAGKAKASGYPSCLLCRENEGYAGHLMHPARQNHRIVPLSLAGESYYLQYSPYVYYNEHCIIFHKNHVPMKIDQRVFDKLLSFVEQFPHYTAGSNADLPIVGGSILSHDHFQGGGYTFAMAKAPYESTFTMKDFPEVTAGIVRWPMSVIRLQGMDKERVAAAADVILGNWRTYTDAEAFIFHETEGTPHNTITPIARRRGELFELDLVLRNNITTEDSPWGVYHPSADLHHIKKENIGLIEVMGLAILPARLKQEMELLEAAILEQKPVRSVPELEKHADWAEAWTKKYDNLRENNIHGIVQHEIGLVFEKVLECAGVYKCDEAGRKAFDRFLDTLR